MSPADHRGAPIIDRDLFEAVIRGVRLGKYHLVLGAGASAGCKNQNGPLPMGGQLSELLLAETGITDHDPVSLQRAYEQAQAQFGSSYVEDLLRSRYSGASPLPWHLLIPRLRWPCIWTFNIDDVVEGAYAQCDERVQTANTVLWKGRPHLIDGLSDSVDIAHLHGYVGNGTPNAEHEDPQLIFSWEEYLSAVQAAAKPTWQSNFRTYFSTYPVIIIGARLTEEIDFSDVIRAGNTAWRYEYPSVVVLPEMSQLQRQEFERWGLQPIECDGETFLGELLTGVEQQSAAISESSPYTSLYVERSLLIRDDPSLVQITPSNASHDFYGGHEPEWSDIAQDLDAVPRWVGRIADEIGSPTEVPNVQMCYALCGEPFTGKSTGLLRLQRELQSRGWEVVQLAGIERIEIDEILKLFVARPRAILFVDPIRFDANEIDRLLRTAESRGQRLIIIGADRSRHLRYIKNIISQRFLIGGAEPVVSFQVTDGFWWAIVNRRRLHARLGRLEGKDEGPSKLYFVAHGRDLYSALADLEDAKGFVNRGIRVFADLSREMQTAFAVISLVGSVGLSIPANAVSSVAGVQVVRLMESLQPAGDLGDWVTLDKHEVGVVRLRHPYLGHLVVSGQVELPDGISFAEIAMGVCLAIAPRVNTQAIRRGTLEYRIAAELMDERLVKKLAKSSEVDTWYAAIEDPYRWNARYWEQRALAQTEGLDKAYSFAQRAVGIRRDGFTLNTLGTVLMRRSVADWRVGSAASAERYWREAVGVLSDAREDFRGRLEPPFNTFFAYTARLVAEGNGPQGVWLTTVRQAFASWLDSARSDGVLEDPEIQQALAKFPEEWRTTR